MAADEREHVVAEPARHADAAGSTLVRLGLPFGMRDASGSTITAVSSSTIPSVTTLRPSSEMTASPLPPSAANSPSWMVSPASTNRST